MALRVLLSEEGHFDGLEDEKGNSVPFLTIECRYSRKHGGGHYKQSGKHGGGGRDPSPEGLQPWERALARRQEREAKEEREFEARMRRLPPPQAALERQRRHRPRDQGIPSRQRHRRPVSPSPEELQPRERALARRRQREEEEEREFEARMRRLPPPQAALERQRRHRPRDQGIPSRQRGRRAPRMPQDDDDDTDEEEEEEEEEEFVDNDIEEKEDVETELWYADEEPPPEVFVREIACDFCGSDDVKIKCDGCKDMLYCGEECAKQDWDRLHQHECQQTPDEKLALQLSEAMNTNEVEGIAAHPADEDYEVLLIEQPPGRRGSAPGRMGRGGGSGPRRGGSAPPARRAPTRSPRRGASAPPARRARTSPFSPLTVTRPGRSFARPPPGMGRRQGRWRRHFGRRRWWSPGLYNWFTHWYPSYGYHYAYRLRYPFLYGPRNRFTDPLWYFDPFQFEVQFEVDRKLKLLRLRYASTIARGFEIVPDFDRGRFRWIRRRF